jgi:ubiquinone/menaquinone biosynthesis C-methylase UbiE
MKKLVRKYLPEKLQSRLRRAYYRYPFLRRIYYFPQNCLGSVFKKKDALQPPRSLMSVGDGNFDQIGREFLGYFTTIGGLQPNERVLEIGCGIGRMAIPLTTYLNETGSYDGFDIARAEVEWCKKNITLRFANFNFQRIDVRNDQTNPKGKFQASSYQFPMAAGQYDFVFLTSVFTHMLIEDIENYLKEISRVLKTGGRTLASYFLLNSETRALLKAKGSRFKYPYGSSLAIDPKMPEASIAHEEKTLRGLYQKFNLRILEPIRYGSWSGRNSFLSAQDIIVAEKIDHGQQHRKKSFSTANEESAAAPGGEPR